MSFKITTAVILAAGAGIRIREFFDVPKGFIEINNKPIIEISIEKLLTIGIKRILIVTGYNSSFYETLAEKYPLIELIFNENYAFSNHLYSLYCIKGLILEGFLLLESDIIYELRALENIVNISEPNAILISAVSGSGDEVFVESNDHHLVNMSKDPADLNSIMGEFVGISLLSASFISKLFEVVEEDMAVSLMESYDTDGIVRASHHFPVHCLVIEDLKWSEIDTYEMYLQAIELF